MVSCSVIRSGARHAAETRSSENSDRTTSMHDDEIILTPAKYKELEAELERLSTVERKAMADRIKEARSLGDLSENFDYHDAKRQQGFLEGKIQSLKQTLERAKVR